MLVSCVVLLLPGALVACSVPIFRYALEHWPADPYQAFVLHRAPLTPEQAALVRDLSPDGLAGQLHANLSVQVVDLAANPSPEVFALAQESATTPLPRLVLRTPRTARTGAVVSTVELTAENVRRLLDSPARQQIVDRLGQGQSAVWVLLESGDREKDEAAAKLLDARLTELASVLTLPKLEAQDIVNGLVSIAQEDLRLEFSVLRVARGDTKELAFIQTLLGTERDLRETAEPIVIPVFGRGRALYAFVGAGLKREVIDQAATFLIGKCSCQVKELNPGADLLLAADWDALVKRHTGALPDRPLLAELAKSAPVTVTIVGAQPAPAQKAAGPSRLIYAACGVAVALLGIVFLLRRRA